ncbi:MAG TPA: serine hydrolase [Gammaproteobacteria bacterium]|nr:serine hydrolase [Gammaproteobacteria bacterium]
MPLLPLCGRSVLLVLAAPLLAVSGQTQTLDDPDHRIRAAFDAAVQHATRLPRLHSLLVSRGAETIVEEYFNGSSPSAPANIKSASKSVISALVGIAIEQGHIASVGQEIGEYFEDLDDPRKAAITVEDLLTMRSGLETTSNRNYGAWVLSRSWVEFALLQPLEHAPGLYMEYSTGNTHLLSAILTAATGQTTLEFAREALSEPLGFRLLEWPQDPQGVHFGGNDMQMTPRQMLAFGQLYMNEGRANGKQIVPLDWVRASLEPRTESRREAGRWYGYGWWIRRMAGLRTPYAWGYGGQFILLVPDLKVVVVTTSDSTPGADRRSQRRAILDLIENDIVAPAARMAGPD